MFLKWTVTKLHSQMLCALESHCRDIQSAAMYDGSAAQNSDVPVAVVLVLYIAGADVTVLN
jgi:hypothetical protein